MYEYKILLNMKKELPFGIGFLIFLVFLSEWRRGRPEDVDLWDRPDPLNGPRKDLYQDLDKIYITSMQTSSTSFKSSPPSDVGVELCDLLHSSSILCSCSLSMAVKESASAKLSTAMARNTFNRKYTKGKYASMSAYTVVHNGIPVFAS
uniref:Uncharacterized protein n=1 Tax=Glossina palpalis gambiensis TaxID=67801 RepID=A0A1B0BD37_9MUSC